jgi:hypothetical protein
MWRRAVPTPVAWSPSFSFNFRLADSQTQVRFVQLRDGSFWVVWTDNKDTGAGELAGTDLVGQRYDAFGVAMGGEVRLNNSFFVDNERNASLAADVGSNEFFVAYEDFNADGSTDIILERKNGDGTPIGFVAIASDPDNTGVGVGFRNPKVAVLSATSGIVVFERTDASEPDSIVAQRFDPSSNTLVGNQLTIAASPVTDATDAQVTVTSDGRYVVVWAAGGNIFANFVTSAGTLAGQFSVSTSGLVESEPSVAALSGGRIVVTWTQNSNIVGAIFDPNGAVFVPTFSVTSLGNVEGDSHVVPTGGANFTVAWEDRSLDQVRMANFNADVGAVSQSGATAIVGNAESVSNIALIAFADGRVLVGRDSPLGQAQIFDTRPAPNAEGVYAPNDLQIGTPGNDTFTAAANANVVDGWDGNDIITDGAGTEVLIRGGNGDDTIRYTFVDSGETADGGPGNDTLVYLSLAGATTINLAAGTATTGGVTQSVLSFENFFTDQAQDITITSADSFANIATGSGNDTINLGSGGGLMLGGLGNDTYIVDSAFDNISELAGQGDDHVMTNLLNYTLPNNVERLTYTGSGFGVTFRGNASNNIIIGSSLADAFFLNQLGNDNVTGGDGNDGFYFGNFFNSADVANGGVGTDDQVAIQGSQSLTISGTMMVGIETLSVLSGSVTTFGDPGGNSYSYSLATLDSLLTGNQVLTVNANTLLQSEAIGFNGSGESTGSFRIFAGAGADVLRGGAGNDGFFFGDNRFNPAVDQVIGGAGNDDQIGLRGNYASELVFGADTISGIETIALISATHPQFGQPGAAFNYNLRLDDNNVGAGQLLIINGAGLASNEIATINGSLETLGNLRLIGGAGNDVLIGGNGFDEFFGGLGADSLTGNGNNDTFIYTAVNQSTAISRDTIFGFGNGNDKVDLSAIDAILGGGTANDSFTFIGSGAFTAAGQVRVVNTLGGIELQANVDANLGADLVIGFANGLSPAQADIIL